MNSFVAEIVDRGTADRPLRAPASLAREYSPAWLTRGKHAAVRERFERSRDTMAGVCSACVMVAAAGATGARTGLQAIRHRWLTQRRARIATIVLMVGAFAVSSVSLSGSTSPAHAAQQAHSSAPR